MSEFTFCIANLFRHDTQKRIFGKNSELLRLENFQPNQRNQNKPLIANYKSWKRVSIGANLMKICLGSRRY